MLPQECISRIKGPPLQEASVISGIVTIKGAKMVAVFKFEQNFIQYCKDQIHREVRDT